MGEDIWGPLGRPIFQDPSAKALARVGVVDVGSNSVRLVVFDGAARSPAYFYNEKIMCGLGNGLAQTGKLNPEGRKRALSALIRFQGLAKNMELAPLSVVATAAVREAEDGADFCAEVKRETGINVYVISGEEEARLSAQGVLLGWPGSYGLVCDIGGSSMELAELSGGRVGACVTSRLGPLRLRTLKGGKKAIGKYIKSKVGELHETIGPQQDRLFLVGGSWRAIARIDMLRRDYPLTVLHEYRMSRSDVTKTVRYIRENDIGDLRHRAGLSEARADLVPLASQVLSEVVRVFKPHDIAISSYGIREGMLYEQMPPLIRDRDPLIESCHFSEATEARFPGFGRRLFDFVLPLFDQPAEERLRLIKAACLLHDVAWRAHPDYRHEVCFDNATRANLGGLTHKERVFIGVALMHRYKNSRHGRLLESLIGLLDPREIRDAETLGKAMRLGSMFSGFANAEIGELLWNKRRKTLTMSLPIDSRNLVGEVVEARFNSLGSTLGAKQLRERYY